MIPAYAFFPPEINSALISSGAGSGPLLMAALAWDGLAADLGGAASSFDSVVSGLAGGPWTGPSSMMMMAAAAPYVAWLHAAAGQAEITAAQAQVAAVAYESALAATVPTPAVHANRAQLTALVATNFLGQNTPAIAMTELEYVEMWAQDVAAMVAYDLGAKTVVSTMPTFSAPPTLLGGLLSLITTPLEEIGSEFLGMFGPLGASFASELQSLLAAFAPAFSSLSTLLSSAPMTTVMSVAQIGLYPATALVSPMMALAQGAGQAAPVMAGATSLAAAGVPAVEAAPVALMQPMGGFGVASAGLGQARWVGSIAVPPTWQGAMPAPVAASAISVLGAPIPTAAVTSGSGGSNGNMRPMPMPVKGKDDPGDKSTASKRRGGPRPAVVRSRPKVVPRSGTK